MTDACPKSTPRIAIYGAGQFGQYIVRLAVQKDWSIVAAYNRAGPKVGQDIGKLAGLGQDLGVIVQDCETADFSTLEADIGMVTLSDRLATNFPAYRRFLTAGVNVLCMAGEAQFPQAIDEDIADEIERMALENGVSFTGSGIWDLSRFWTGMLVASNCTEIRSLFHRSLTNTEAARVETITQLGAGMTPEEFDEKIGRPAGLYGNLFKAVPKLVLSELGYTVITCEERREPVFSDRPFHCKTLGRDFPAGSIMGSRTIIETATAEGVTATVHVEGRLLFREGEVEHMMWSVDGMPSNTITIERKDSTHATASSLFNRIPDVIAAPPGIQPVTRLGPIKHTALA